MRQLIPKKPSSDLSEDQQQALDLVRSRGWKNKVTVGDDCIPRDYYGRPLVVKGKKVLPYSRPSSLFKGDSSGLENWVHDCGVVGLLRQLKKNPEALLGYQAELEQCDGKWSSLQSAKDSAAASPRHEASSLGTTIHNMVQDAIENPWGDFDSTVPDVVTSILEMIDERWKVERCEQTLVCDTLQTMGSADYLMRYVGPKHELLNDEQLFVGDLKTGKLKYDVYTVQMSSYAHSVCYDPLTGEREQMNICGDYGVIFHAPVKGGKLQEVVVSLKDAYTSAKEMQKARRRMAGPSKFVEEQLEYKGEK